MEVDTLQIKDLITDIFKADLVPMISSSPGVGKSDIMRQIADEYNLEVIDFRLAQCDPTDLMGFPTLNKDHSRCDYAPPIVFPIKGDVIPKGKEGWLIFLDELPSAPNSVQAASYKIVLDRMIGSKNLHEQVFIAAAGNLETDNAIVNRMSTAMQSRLIHLKLEVSVKGWLNWANTNELDYRIIAYINFKPEALHKFDPEHSDNTFQCPRTWHFLSKIIKNWSIIPKEKLAILAGTIGEGVAYEFKAFTDIMEGLPSIDKMLATPKTIPIPDDPSTLYAITGLIAHHVNKKNIDKLIQLIDRLPLEFQVICLQDSFKGKNSKDIYETPSIREWLKKNHKLLKK